MALGDGGDQSECKPVFIDAHIHLFDPRRPQGVPWPSREASFFRPTLPADFLDIAAPVGATGAVCVECSRWVEDNQWVLDVARSAPVIKAVVGYLDFMSPKFAEQLQRFRADPLFRGVRMRPEQALDFSAPSVRRNLRAMADAGLVVEVQAPDAQQLAKCFELGQEWGGIRFVLDHLAHPRIDGAPDIAWRQGMDRIGSLPNFVCKVSRLTEATLIQPAPLELDFYRQHLDVAWNAFGENRLLFGSNWPPCSKAGDYCLTVTLTRDYFSQKGLSALRKVMELNVAGVYGGPRFCVAADAPPGE